MTAAFVETTVLTDYLLKRDGSEENARVAFYKFQQQIVPQFAWKEFKRGPLKNFVWAHNKFADTKSFLETVGALQRLSRSPQRYLTATAIQALHSAFAGMFDNLDELRRAHQGKANPDAIHADVLRLELKRAIFSAWKARNTLFGGAYHVLTCYPDAPIKEASKRIEIDPKDCPNGIECCLKAPLAKRKHDLAAIRAALKGNTDRLEVARRGKVLRQLEKHFSSLMSAKDCQAFGDAYFVLFCPAGAVIITTNLRDIEPMAAALGITVARP
jgi:hypothetical protein